jgi:hypothetical protein
VKTFIRERKRIETRLFMRHPDGVWAGYSYEWNEAQTEATLLSSGKVKDVGGVTWTYPSRAQCMQCHTAAAGFSLGPESAQLNGDFEYPGKRVANQLDTLVHIGILSGPGPKDPVTAPRLERPIGAAPIASRARSSLHANCGHCHRPGGPGRGSGDLRFGTPWQSANICDALPEIGDLGVPGARWLVPGRPDLSLLSLRTHRLDAARMPPLGSRLVDPVGTAVLDEWISSISACPAAIEAGERALGRDGRPASARARRTPRCAHRDGACARIAQTGRFLVAGSIPRLTRVDSTTTGRS